MLVTLVLLKGDITQVDCEAIVNPANSLMLMGGGVASAIKRRGGLEIEREAWRYAPVPIGKAVSTGGGRLRAKYVIHSPTMELPAQRTTREKVYLAIKAALLEAKRLGVKCVAFPGMGTGVGGLSYLDFVDVFSRAVIEMGSELGDMKIILVAFDNELYNTAKVRFKDLGVYSR